MALTSDVVAQQIQERLGDISTLVHAIENNRARSENNLEKIEEIQNEVKDDEKNSASVKQRKLKLVYGRAVDDAKEQEALLRDALGNIHEIRKIREERRLKQIFLNKQLIQV